MSDLFRGKRIDNGEWVEGFYLVLPMGETVILSNNGYAKIDPETERDGLKALASIFAIDIQPDNVQESRQRLKAMYRDKFPDASDFAFFIADKILANNIVCGDSLQIMEKWEAEKPQ